MQYKPISKKRVVKKTNRVRQVEKKESVPQRKRDFSQVRITSLPSNFLFYPKDAEIMYRPYGWGEIKTYSQAAQSNNLTIKDHIDFVLSGVTTTFDINKLTLSDYLYIGVLRKMSNGSEDGKVSVRYACTTCNTTYCIATQITHIPYKSLDFEELKSNEIPNVPIIANLRCGTFRFRPFTVDDYFHLLKINKVGDVTAMLTCMALDDISNFDEVYKTFKFMDDNDGQVIDVIDGLLNHGLKPVKVICDKCKAEGLVELDAERLLQGGKVIVSPFRERADDVRDRICFGD